MRLPAPREGEDAVTAMMVQEGQDGLYVLLTPRLTPGERVRAPRASGNQQIAGEQPHLPDLVKVRNIRSTLRARYRLCVDRRGEVISIEPQVPILGAHGSMLRALQTWRFVPQPEDDCLEPTFTFSID